jgi:hypothetical protein
MAELLRSKRLLRPFAFVFDNVDTLQGTPFLPVYLTETLSNYYYQRAPVRRREVIRASKTLGINNPSVNQLLCGMDQNVDFYYHYKVVDTQWVNSRLLLPQPLPAAEAERFGVFGSFRVAF